MERARRVLHFRIFSTFVIRLLTTRVAVFGFYVVRETLDSLTLCGRSFILFFLFFLSFFFPLGMHGVVHRVLRFRFFSTSTFFYWVKV